MLFLVREGTWKLNPNENYFVKYIKNTKAAFTFFA